MIDDKDSRGQGFKGSSEMPKKNIKKTLEPLTPRILDPFLPTSGQKNHNQKFISSIGLAVTRIEEVIDYWNG